MPRLEDSLKIIITDEPEPEPQTNLPSPQLTANSGGSDMPDGKPFVRDPVIDKLMDDDIPLEDSLPEIDEPEFVMKPPPKDEDLFEPEPEPEKKVKIEEEIYPMDPEFKKRTPTGKLRKPKGINSNGKKRKPMSEEHKQKLAVAREKALAKRRANAQKRKEEREKLNPPKQPEPEVKKESPRPPTPAKEKPRASITREDLEEISLKTVIAMETMRKKRKEEKKKKKAEEQYKGEVMETIRKANPSWMETSGIYANCY